MSTGTNPSPTDLTANEADAQLIEPVGYDFGLSRRGFVQILSAGLMIAAGGPPALAQRNGRRGGFGGSGCSSASSPATLLRRAQSCDCMSGRPAPISRKSPR